MAEFLKLMEGWNQFHGARESRVSEAQVMQFMELLTDRKMPAHRRDYLMREVITTSDFPDLFGFVIDRDMLARYRVAATDWKSYFKMATATNFNTIERHKVVGNDDRLPEVAEKGEYLVGETAAGYYYYKIKKYGRQFDISWEAIVNDAMGAFSDLAARFANAAIRSEAYRATSTYAAAGGPNGALFGATITDAADGQAVTNQGVLALSIGNLETTLELMRAQTDVNGSPIGVMGKHLVVPPALEFTARQILTSAMKMWTYGGDDEAAPVAQPMTNVLPQMGLQLHVDPFLPVVDVSANRNGTWYVFADPAQGAAMEWAYLRGYENPEICMKNSDKVTVGGGSLSPFSGDFATDNILYRVRHVFGSGQLDPRFAYAQVHT